METKKLITSEMVGIPADVGDSIEKLSEFCKKNAFGCSKCPLFVGIDEEHSGCIYQNLALGEISLQKVMDVNTFHTESPSEGLPACGETVTIGNNNFVVLDYIDDCVIVITERFIRFMEFGNSTDYENSCVRNYLNGDLYQKYCNEIGAENIVKHRVRLVAEDGTGDDRICEDYISLPTVDMFKKYRHLLAYDGWWWTATAETSSTNYDEVVCINCDSRFDRYPYYDSDGGVRAICMFKTSVLEQ